MSSSELLRHQSAQSLRLEFLKAHLEGHWIDRWDLIWRRNGRL